MEKPHEYSRHSAKTKIGNFLCKIGFHWWEYDSYRTCKRCGRSQTLYGYNGGVSWWED